jgi:hypothetical protein
MTGIGDKKAKSRINGQVPLYRFKRAMCNSHRIIARNERISRIAWVLIGEGLKLLRAKADKLGGRNAFKHLLESNDLGYFASSRGKSTATNLLRIMNKLPEVQEWHKSLNDRERYEWASPRAVIQHATLADKVTRKVTRLFPAKRRHQQPGAKPKATEEVVELRRANADLQGRADDVAAHPNVPLNMQRPHFSLSDVEADLLRHLGAIPLEARDLWLAYIEPRLTDDKPVLPLTWKETTKQKRLIHAAETSKGCYEAFLEEPIKDPRMDVGKYCLTFAPPDEESEFIAGCDGDDFIDLDDAKQFAEWHYNNLFSYAEALVAAGPDEDEPSPAPKGGKKKSR